MTDRFEGFGPGLYEFFEDLEDNNTKEWFEEHRADYQTQVKEPLGALLAELEPTWGSAKVFRINRDIRFSHDKSPYKTQQGAIIWRGGAGSLYLHVSADGLMAGVGAPHLDKGQLERWRAAVAGSPGEALADIVAGLRSDGFTVGTLGGDGLTEDGDLKRVPKPYPPDHPRADLLRLKKVVAARSWDRPRWLSTRRVLTEVTTAWSACGPLADWLAANVGEGTEEPRRR